MSFFRNIANELISGAASATVDNLRAKRPAQSSSQIEHLCQQLGWGIDNRYGSHGVGLNFKDSIVGTRQILVTTGTAGTLAAFSVFSKASFPAGDIPPDMAAYLLARNANAQFVSWKAVQADNGDITFAVSYLALVAGLDAGIFKLVCQNLMSEVQDLDSKLRQMGAI